MLTYLLSTVGADFILDMMLARLLPQYPDSSSTFTLTLQIVDDDILEEMERLTLMLQLVTPINLTNDSYLMATIIIVDDEGKNNQYLSLLANEYPPNSNPPMHTLCLIMHSKKKKNYYRTAGNFGQH